MIRPKKIACVGEAMIELSTTRGKDAHVGVAGDTFNTSVYMHRTAPDLQIEYLTCLGDDPFSDRIADAIAAEGVGTQAIRRINGATPGLYAITTDHQGERSFTYWRESAAARRMFEGAREPDFSILSAYDAVYLSGISIAILPIEVRNGLLEWLNAHSTLMIFDSNYRPKLWDSVETARKVTSAFWERADIALPSIDDEMELFAEDAARVVSRFEALSTQGALKRGAEGPLSLGESVDQTYEPAKKVVDTTAAGDSFNGGYLGCLFAGGTQREALLAGHNCAANVVQHRGAIIPK